RGGGGGTREGGERGVAGLRCRAREQGGLHGVVVEPSRPQATSELLELGHLQPAVLGDDERDGPTELTRESFYLLRLGGDPSALALDLGSGLELRQAAALLLITKRLRSPFLRTRRRQAAIAAWLASAGSGFRPT